MADVKQRRVGLRSDGWMKQQETVSVKYQLKPEARLFLSDNMKSQPRIKMTASVHSAHFSPSPTKKKEKQRKNQKSCNFTMRATENAAVM